MAKKRKKRKPPRKLRRELPKDLPVEVMYGFTQVDLALHAHGFFELVVVSEGRGVHLTDAGKYPIVAGDVFVVSGTREHGYKETSKLVITNILFRPERLPMPMMDIRALPGYHALFTLEPQYRHRHKFESRLHLRTQDLARVLGWAKSLEDELKRKTPGYRFFATSLLMQIVGFLSRCYSETTVPAARPLLRIGETISYLEANYAQPIVLDELQHIAHMSKSSLLRTFREALGVSPIEYLIRLRISRATELLRNDDMSITEIAFKVGFSDSNYFARQFRSIMNISPREFRQRLCPRAEVLPIARQRLGE